MSDYDVPSPVWVQGEGVVSDLNRLGVSSSLQHALLSWQRYFTSHYSIQRRPHWDLPGASEVYADRGHALRDRLARELPHAKIVLDLWPVEDNDDTTWD